MLKSIPAGLAYDMKTYSNLKRLAIVSSFALLASTCPTFAQNDANTASSSAQSNRSSLNSSSSSAQTTPSLMAERTNNYNNGATVNEPAGADNTGASNWSWFGLLGLLGLFGLKRTHDVRDENYRSART
jgi:hypothetical protein